jgi:hypothetical protein
MRDTPHKITEMIHEMIQKKSPLERALMGSSMYETSKQLLIRAIKENHPSKSERELKQEFFLRFYGTDFSPIEQEKIIRHLMNC